MSVEAQSLKRSKKGNLNIWNSATGQTPSADEDHAIRSKAPEQLIHGP